MRAKIVGPDALLYGLNHSVRVRGIDDTAAQDRLKATIDSLENFVIAPIDARTAVLQKQMAMLERLADHSGALIVDESRQALEVRAWETAYGIVSRQMLQVADSLRGLDLKRAKIVIQLDKSKAEWDRIQNQSLQQHRIVNIDLSTRVPGRYTVTLSYVVANATWRSFYSARLSDSGQVDFDYFALIQQRTGEDWSDVELTLSTARPDRAAAPGETRPRLLSVLEIVSANRDLLRITETANLRQITAENIKRMPVSTVQDLLKNQVELIDVAAQVVVRDAATTSFSTQFKARRKESIASGENWARTQINHWTFSGSISYQARTQTSSNVFRFVKVKNESESPLLPGTIALFAESDFVGALNSRSLILPSQEFELAFGIDDHFEIEREIVNRRNSVDGDNRKLEETIEIRLVNHGEKSATVEIEDAVPVSNDNRIKVKVKSIAPRVEVDKENGLCNWNLSLAPGQENKIAITYEIEHPSSLTVAGM